MLPLGSRAAKLLLGDRLDAPQVAGGIIDGALDVLAKLLRGLVEYCLRPSVSCSRDKRARQADFTQRYHDCLAHCLFYNVQRPRQWMT